MEAEGGKEGGREGRGRNKRIEEGQEGEREEEVGKEGEVHQGVIVSQTVHLISDILSSENN